MTVGFGCVRYLAPLALAAAACGGAPLRLAASPSVSPSADGGAGVGGAVTRALAAGGAQTCALEKAGLYCWGENSNGELGSDPGTALTGPVAVAGLDDGVVEVEANSNQTCARLADGRVECWGWNTEGQLGDGTRVDRARPGLVPGIDDAVEVAAGGLSTCVRRAGGAVACWGAFGFGFGSLSPVEVTGVADAVELRATQGFSKYCARTRAGQVFCWTLLDSTPSPPAAAIPALAGTHDIAIALSQICGLTDANNVVCADPYGQDSIAHPVEGVDDAVQLAAGTTFVCWRRAGGGVGCRDFYDNVIGSDRRDFVLDSPAVDLVAGQVHFCARVSDGGVECFHDPTMTISYPLNATDGLVRVNGLPP
jgi:hypothetical protein